MQGREGAPDAWPRVLSTAGAVATWDRGRDFGPHWYPLALIATAMPCAWAGGWLHAMRLRDAQR